MGTGNLGIAMRTLPPFGTFRSVSLLPELNAEMDVLGWSAGKADWQELIWSTGIMILLAPRD
jgi:hypothetical protein